ncbi:pimeloyl-ACP methyl ester carboxylesterase [Kitasatospora sp. MAP12-15]|uniref:alpha/beta fold hydrolase n=1 Tax=unclassified Kitasatospora TaxID=2633591 RepID=UPI002473F84D|nr:alpha/beta hydrolase [Kitasatospora sp. MAP12-44]MDH6114038.1 pimeloyl-ACP methyl ester carboxylesterase [Kitasatospora sp. MAP12-44]
MSPVTPADCVLPTPVRELSICSADGSRLHAAEYGVEGAPLVVLVHGWTCSVAFWAPVLHQLADSFRVVAYDQRGHGRSDSPATKRGYSTTALADDLEAVVRAVVPAGERAVLVGHSMGGMTIMAAGDRPAVAERTAAALLVSTGPSELVEELLVLPAVRPSALRRVLHRHLLRSRLPLGPVTALSRALLKYGTMGPATPVDRADASARIVQACPTMVRARWADVLGELDVTAGLAKLAAPTAIVVGTADRLTPPVHARRMRAALSASEGLLELPGVGHMSPIERPAEVAAEIRRLVGAHLTPAAVVTPERTVS